MSVSAQRERVARATSQIRLLYELRYRARRRPDPIDVSRFWAVRHDRPALVDHAVDDPRFYAHVDRQTNMETRFVEALAAEIGGVYERKRLDDLLGRQLRRFAGLVLLVPGIVCGAGAVLAHLAWALPLGELAARPALQAAAVATATGTALLGLGWRKDRDGR